MSTFELTVINCLLDLNETITIPTVIGEMLYRHIFLVNRNEFKNVPSMKSADKIRLANSIGSLKKIIPTGSNVHTLPLEFRVEYLISLPRTPDTVMALLKLDNAVSTGKSYMNPTTSEEFAPSCRKKLRTAVCGWTSLDIYQNPASFHLTPHDHLIPGAGIKPRQHQLDLMNAVSEFWNVPKLEIRYDPMIGSGKTTSVVALARRWNLIYVCNHFPICEQVKELRDKSKTSMSIIHGIQNLGKTIKRGSEYYNEEEEEIIPESEAKSRAESERIGRTHPGIRPLYYTSPEDIARAKIQTFKMAMRIHDVSQKYQEYKNNLPEDILDIVESKEVFHIPEDAIVFIDEPNQADYDFMQKHNIRRCIYASATFTGLNDSVLYIKGMPYPESGIRISSSECHIGCTLISDGKVLIPNDRAQCRIELDHVLAKIKEQPFLQRCYTIEVAKAYSLSFLDELKISSMTTEGIKSEILGYLKATVPEKQEFPSPGKKESGMKLVIVDDPVVCALNNKFPADVAKFVKTTLDSYQQNFAIYQQRIVAIKVKDAQEYARRVSEIEIPVIPRCSRVQSENIQWNNLEVQPELKFLLMTGIGVYNGMKTSYTREVLKQASLGTLNTLISNRSMSHGVNYAIDTIELHVRIPDPVELFQLIGRAGRVGKSWTACAIIPDSVTEDIYNFVQ